MVKVKHHNNMSEFMATYIDELTEAFTDEESSLLKAHMKGRRGHAAYQASLYSGSGIGDMIQSAHF